MKIFRLYPGLDSFYTKTGVYLPYIDIVAENGHDAIKIAVQLQLSIDCQEFAETPEQLTSMLAGHPTFITTVHDDRTERQRVIDELINDNDIDPNTTNGSVILSYLKRNRTKQID